MIFLRSIVIITCCFLLLACGKTTPVYEGQGFSIHYPQEWIVSTDDKSVLVTVSHANRTLKRVDGTLTVVAQPLGNTSFSALQKANEETLKNTSINLNFQADHVKINTQDTLLWKYQRTGADTKKTFFRQSMVTDKDIIYTITAIGEESISVSDLEDAVKSFVVPN